MQVRITDGGDLRRLSRDLRKFKDGKELNKAFVKEVREEAKKVQKEVRAGYRSAPAWGGEYHRPGGSLRSMLARATTLKVRISRKPIVAIGVRGDKMPDGMRGLPKAYEGVTRWRHPVFGTNAWVGQSGRPVFTRIVPKSKRKVEKAVGKVAEKHARRIARG